MDAPVPKRPATMARCEECRRTPREDHALWCSGRRNVKPLDDDSYDDAVELNRDAG